MNTKLTFFLNLINLCYVDFVFIYLFIYLFIE